MPDENGVVEGEQRRGGVVRVATEFHVARPADEAFDFWPDARNELRTTPAPCASGRPPPVRSGSAPRGRVTTKAWSR
jgi:hypothetical protein